MHKELKVRTTYIHYGYSFSRFALGFSIDKWHMDIDLFFFWVGVEW